MSWSVLNIERDATLRETEALNTQSLSILLLELMMHDLWCRTNKFWTGSLWNTSSPYPWRWGISWPIVISCATFWYKSWLLSTIDSRMARDLCSTAESVDDLHTKLAICSGRKKKKKKVKFLVMSHRKKKRTTHFRTGCPHAQCCTV